MAAFYRDAHLKIGRAKKHVEDFKAAILAQEDTYSSTIQHHHESGAESLIHEFPDFENALRQLSLIAGDAFHNMRSALDFAWHSTISRLLPDKLSDSTRFPVRPTRQDVEAALHGIEIDTRCKPLFDCIVFTIQPYRESHNSAVWTLDQIDISDKRMLRLGLDPVGHIRGITVRDSNGERHRGSSMPAKGLSGKYVIDFAVGLNVEDKGKLSVTVNLQEAGIYSPVPLVDLLDSFSGFSLHTVKLLENL
jgi:hypothetical protein